MSLLDLFAEARLLVPLLKRWSETLHHGVPVTGPMRAVLDALHRDGPMPAPEIARALGVSRQHVQLQVDALLDAGYAERRLNPAHKRSSLIALTNRGRALTQNIHADEARALSRLQTGVSDEAISEAVKALAACRLALVKAQS